MSQREAFEAWHEWHCKPGVGYWFDRCSVNPDEYHMSHTQTARDAWQAAIESVKQQVPLSMRDPLRQSSVLVQEWNEGAADQDEWGNEACQAILELYSCIATLLIEAAEKQAATATVKESLTVQYEPVAWAVFADNGNSRVWFREKKYADQWIASHGGASDVLTPLYVRTEPTK